MPEFFVLSLGDQLSFLRTCYRDYVLRALNGFAGSGKPPFESWNYDGVDFLVALVQEISFMEDPARAPSALPQSTQLLVNAGFDPKTATWLACEIFKSITDLIGAYFPDASFGPYAAWDFAVVNGCDLAVSKPRSDQAPPQSAATVIEYYPPTAVPGMRPASFDWDSDFTPQPPAMLTSSEIEAKGRLD